MVQWMLLKIGVRTAPVDRGELDAARRYIQGIVDTWRSVGERHIRMQC